QLVLPAGETPSGQTPGYTPEALLRRKSFDEIAAHEVAALERLLARLALRLATRRSRRLVPTRARGTIDLRRSFRAALATEGEFIRLARRMRSLDEPRLVFLYDTSGSMDPHTRFHLAFAFALRRVIGRVEIFAFNTVLTRVTTAVTPLKTARSLADLAAAVPDWSGGTRIGACLAEFMTAYADALVRSDTSIVIVSDGLDRGDPAVLANALSALHGRACSIFWLNPLLGDARYRPLADGMAAALPHIDYFGPAHNVEALEKFVRSLH
ncbi:MAG TPA: VWA domain-containing protein, partial [Burkholderiaceae bacterium]|nr:VWA domain-containing protein [Burkholderiaceae bacterium]